MAFDAHKNLAVSSVATAPTPATSGTSLVVAAGEGVRFPAPPFNITIWPANATPSPANAEVGRVTGRATDTLTLVRAQEGSTARAVGVGDLVAQTITAKTLTDLETQAALLAAANVFTAAQTIQYATPQLVFTDTAQPAGAQSFDIVDFNQRLGLRAIGGAETLLLTRGGDALIANNLYEKGRTLPLGHWTTGDASSYGPAGFTGPVLWSLIGKTLFLVMAAAGPGNSATSLRFTLPGGCVAGAGSSTPISLINQIGFAHFAAGGNFFDAIQAGSAAFPAGSVNIQCSIVIPIY